MVTAKRPRLEARSENKVTVFERKYIHPRHCAARKSGIWANWQYRYLFVCLFVCLFGGSFVVGTVTQWRHTGSLHASKLRLWFLKSNFHDTFHDMFLSTSFTMSFDYRVINKWRKKTVLTPRTFSGAKTVENRWKPIISASTTRTCSSWQPTNHQPVTLRNTSHLLTQAQGIQNERQLTTADDCIWHFRHFRHFSLSSA